MHPTRCLLAASVLMGVFSLGAVRTADADPIPYPNAGSYNPTTYSFTAATTGDVTAYLVGGHGAGFSNEVGVLDNGVLTSAGYGLENHSPYGTTFDLGSVTAGDTLTFVLHNLSLGMNAYSDPSMNAAYDAAGVTGHNHVYSTAYTGTSPVFAGVPTGLYVAFEDLPFPGTDFNYDDESFVFTNVNGSISSVPEPGAFGLLAGALVPISALAIRRRRNAGKIGRRK